MSGLTQHTSWADYEEGPVEQDFALENVHLALKDGAEAYNKWTHAFGSESLKIGFEELSEAFKTVVKTGNLHLF